MPAWRRGTWHVVRNFHQQQKRKVLQGLSSWALPQRPPQQRRLIRFPGPYSSASSPHKGGRTGQFHYICSVFSKYVHVVYIKKDKEACAEKPPFPPSSHLPSFRSSPLPCPKEITTSTSFLLFQRFLSICILFPPCLHIWQYSSYTVVL